MPATAAPSGAPTQAPSLILGNTRKSVKHPRRSSNGAAFRGDGEGRKFSKTALQRVAAGLLFDGQGSRRQEHKVCHCCRSIRGESVSLYRRKDGSGARFGGLLHCDSGWECPVCAASIAERRREELSPALVRWVAGGGRAHLLTLTFPHEADWPLDDLMFRFGEARKHLKNSATYKRIMKGAERAGSAASLEVTHGENGWHPHLHELVFVRRVITDEEAQRLSKQWVKSLLKHGIGDSSRITDMMAHALDLRGGEDAAAYIAKYGREEQWGITSELTRSGSKVGSDGGVTPFGMLRLVMEGETQYGPLFVEYAKVFKGKKLMTMTPGLRDKLGMTGKDPEEATDAPPLPEEQFVGALSEDQWDVVMKRDARDEVLRYVADNCIDPNTGQADLDDFIAYLAAREGPKCRGWFVSHMERRFDA